MQKILFRSALAACAGSLLLSSNVFAAAPVTPRGTVFSIIQPPQNGISRGQDAAYDARNAVYLVVSNNDDAGIRRIYGRFVGKNGTLVGAAAFLIQAGGAYSHFPRVAYSADADNGNGAFLVVWLTSDLPFGLTSIHGRFVSYTNGGPLGGEFVVENLLGGTWYEYGPAIAYAGGQNKEFLVTWMGPFPSGGPNILAQRISLAGQQLGTPIPLTNTPNDWERESDVAYNPQTDEFYVVYGGAGGPCGCAYVAGQRIKPGTGQLIGTATQLVGTAVTYIPAVQFIQETGKYLVVWYQGSSAGINFSARRVNADGTPDGGSFVVGPRFAYYDSLGLAYNRYSRSSLLVSHSSSAEVSGVELDINGIPTPAGQNLITATGSRTGNFYPRVTANNQDGDWLVVVAYELRRTIGQFMTTNDGSPGPPPPGPVSAPKMVLDTPTQGQTLRPPFTVGGWAIDTTSTAGPGIDAVHVYAFPNPGSGQAPTFLGSATMGIARPDIGSIFGPTFTNSGWTLTVNNLGPGTYQIVAYGHSTLTGTFNIARAAVITVPRTAWVMIDGPTNNASIPAAAGTFIVAGWALDTAAPSGTGVEDLHIWALPTSGAPGVFLGVATYGVARPDVAGHFGDARFTNTGYSLTAATAALVPGQYYIIVFARSSLTHTFNSANLVVVRVQ